LLATTRGRALVQIRIDSDQLSLARRGPATTHVGAGFRAGSGRFTPPPGLPDSARGQRGICRDWGTQKWLPNRIIPCSKCRSLSLDWWDGLKSVRLGRFLPINT